jgi:carbonic anhydrase
MTSTLASGPFASGCAPLFHNCSISFGRKRPLGSSYRQALPLHFISYSIIASRAEVGGASVSVTDELVSNAQSYEKSFDAGDLPLPPAKRVAIVACMDARLNPYGLLGLREGDAHVIRNAGGVITDDEIRSLSISQRLLGTEEIMLIHHTDCGMLTFSDDDFRRQVQDETGVKPEWAAEAFDDLEEDVRQSIARIEASPFIPNKDKVRGFIYEVETGRLREVT